MSLHPNASRPLGFGLLVMLGTLACNSHPAAGLADADSTSTVTFYTHDGAETLYRHAKYDQAREMCLQAVAGIEKARGAKSPQLAPPLIDLATVYLRQAKFADAKTVIDRAESVLDRNKPDEALLVGRLAINKGWRLYALGETAAAQAVFEDARTLLQKNVKGDSLDLAEIINNLALTYEDSPDRPNRAVQARSMLLQGYEMRRRLTGTESPEYAESVNNLGMFDLDHADSEESEKNAVKELEVSLQLAIKVYTEDSPETAQSHSNLAIAYLHVSDLGKAEREVRKALPVTAKFFGPDHPDRAGELVTLGEIQQRALQYDAAELSYHEALKINEKVFGSTNSNVLDSLTILQHLYEANGNDAKLRAIKTRIENLSGKEI